MLLERIYQKLYEESVCGSGYEFSIRFLGKSRSYYSVIKTKNIEPSMDAISTLEIALRNEANNYQSNIPFINDIRSSLLKLSNQVKDYRENRSNNNIMNNNYWM